MTAWHYEWQKQFPLNSQEKVFTIDGKTHRADVFINNIVIEFQHSPISRIEFNDRNTFYNHLGYHVVWIFDAREKYIEYLGPSYYETSRLFSWKYPIKFLEKCDENRKRVTIFLQIEESNWNKQNNNKKINDFNKIDIKPNLIKIDSLIDGFSKFETKDYYSDIEILNIILKNDSDNKQWYNYKLKPNLVALCDCINNDEIYSYCPKYEKDVRFLDECHICYNFVSRYNGCNYRFKDIEKRNINYIYSINRDNDGRIIETDLLIENERRKQKIQTLPKNNRTIKSFINKNPNMRVARFKNTYDGIIVQLGFNNMRNLKEKNICEGKICGYNNYTSSERIIYNWDKSSWVMIWKKDIDDPYKENNEKLVSPNIKIESRHCPKCGGLICLLDNENKVGCHNYPKCDYVI